MKRIFALWFALLFLPFLLCADTNSASMIFRDSGVLPTISTSGASTSTPLPTTSTLSAISLSPGWNMISSPINGQKIDKILFTNSGITAIWAYDPAANKYIVPLYIDAGIGYWVQSASSKTLPLTSSSLSNGSTVTIDSILASAAIGKWNLLGTPIDTTKTLLKVKGASVVWWYDPTIKNSDGTIGNYSANDAIKAGSGFWLKTDTGLVAAATTGSTTSSFVDQNITDFNATVAMENALSNLKPDSVISVISANTTATAIKKSNSVEVATPNFSQSSDLNTAVITGMTLTQAQSKINKPLFVNGEFKGVVSSAKQASNGSVNVALTNANTISDAFDSFDLTFDSSSVDTAKSIRALQDSLPPLLGTYDALNKEPLKVSIKTASIKNSRGLDSVVPVLRIDIPQGYYVPLDDASHTTRDTTASASIECSLFGAYCNADVQGGYTNKIDLSQTDKAYGLTFSSAGSFVEYGLSALFGAKASNLYLEPVLDTKFLATTYLNSDITYTISGKKSGDFKERPMNLVKGFEYEIRHPYSLIAKTTIFIKPDIFIGAKGDISGKLTYKSAMSLKGSMSVGYNSQTGFYEPSSTSQTPSSQATLKNSVEFAAKADANAYAYPEIGISPKIYFARINLPLTIGFIRNGINENLAVHGEVATGFTVTDSEMNDKLQAGASMTLTAKPIVDCRLDVKLGSAAIYTDKSYKTLYEGDSTKLFDWTLKVLRLPTITVASNSKAGKDVTFSDADGNKGVQFVYTTDKSDPKVTNNNGSISIANGKLYTTPLNITTNTTVKVLSYYQVPQTAQWQFGTSISNVASQDITIPPNTAASPTCLSSQKLVSGICATKTCQADNYNCPNCTSSQTLTYNSDGSGACKDKPANNQSNIFSKPAQSACTSAGGDWDDYHNECAADWNTATKLCTTLPSSSQWLAIKTGTTGFSIYRCYWTSKQGGACFDLTGEYWAISGSVSYYFVRCAQ